MTGLRVGLAVVVAVMLADGVGAAAKQGSPERNAECAIDQALCKAQCPPLPADPGCAPMCDVAFFRCLAAPDAQGSRAVGGRPKLQIAPRSIGR